MILACSLILYSLSFEFGTYCFLFDCPWAVTRISIERFGFWDTTKLHQSFWFMRKKVLNTLIFIRYWMNSSIHLHWILLVSQDIVRNISHATSVWDFSRWLVVGRHHCHNWTDVTEHNVKELSCIWSCFFSWNWSEYQWIVISLTWDSLISFYCLLFHNVILYFYPFFLSFSPFPLYWRQLLSHSTMDRISVKEFFKPSTLSTPDSDNEVKCEGLGSDLSFY